MTCGATVRTPPSPHAHATQLRLSCRRRERRWRLGSSPSFLRSSNRAMSGSPRLNALRRRRSCSPRLSSRLTHGRDHALDDHFRLARPSEVSRPPLTELKRRLHDRLREVLHRRAALIPVSGAIDNLIGHDRRCLRPTSETRPCQLVEELLGRPRHRGRVARAAVLNFPASAPDWSQGVTERLRASSAGEAQSAD